MGEIGFTLLRNCNCCKYVARGIGIWIFFDQSIGIGQKDWENFNRRAVLPREHLRFVGGTRARDGSVKMDGLWMILARFCHL